MVTHIRFVGSVRYDTHGEEIVSDELFFGDGFLDYVDNLFFYLPFSSKYEADKTRAKTGTRDDVWAKVRARLHEDHRKPENRSILIQAWKDYVANSFEQPTDDGLNRIVCDDEAMLAFVDEDEIQAPPSHP